MSAGLFSVVVTASETDSLTKVVLSFVGNKPFLMLALNNRFHPLDVAIQVPRDVAKTGVFS